MYRLPKAYTGITMNRRHNLNRLAHFVAVIEEGTITAAADRLGISKAVVSKQLLTLEDEIGVGLLIRNSRHLSPTDAGREFYTRAKSVLEQANEAFDAVTSGIAEPKGLIRVTAPVDYGTMHIAPLVAEFARLYPKVEVDLMLSDERLDPVEQRFDIAFRVGWLEDSSNLARKIGTFEELAVCAQDCPILPKVLTPADLSKIPFIANKTLMSQSQLLFTRGNDTIEVSTNTSVSMDVSIAIRNAVQQGGGFAILPDFLVAEDLQSARLVHLLPQWHLRSGGIYAVFPPVKFRSTAVQTLLDKTISYHKENFARHTKLT